MAAELIVRIAHPDDLPQINRLIHSMGIGWFGNIRSKYDDLHKMFQIYQSHRLIVLESPTSTNIIAYAEFCNYPPIDGLPRDEWLQWLQYRYCLHMPITMQNTLFFNFCIYKEEYPDVIKTICREAYYTEGKIVHIITVKMPHLARDKFFKERYEDLERYASIIYPHDFSLENNTNTQSLYIIFRFEILPKIVYRKALPEDNDDIIEMQEFDYPELRAELGDYYIAEELLGRNENKGEQDFIIVAEIEQPNGEYESGGFLWLSKNVNVRFLVKNYELSSFGNLVRYNENLPSRSEQIKMSKIRKKPDANLFSIEAMDNLNMNIVAEELVNLEATLSLGNVLRFSSMVDKSMSKHLSKMGVSDKILQKFAYISSLLLRTTYYTIKDTYEMNFLYNVEGDDPDAADAKIISNVFLMKYIGLHTKYPINRLFNCLINAFSAFPDCEYCMMSISKQSSTVRCNQEVLKYFLPVVQCPTSLRNLDNIYITHRSTLHGEISLHFMQEADIELIKAFVQDTCAHPNYSSSSSNIEEESVESKQSTKVHTPMDEEMKTLMAIMKDFLNNSMSTFSVLTIRCGSSSYAANDSVMIGFVALQKFYRYRQLSYHFHLPKFNSHLNSVRAEIITMRLHPLFRIWSDSIFRDIARKTGYLDFYFILPKLFKPFKNELKEYMMVIEPKPRKNICVEVEASKKPPSGKVKLHDNNFYTDHLMLFRHKLNPTKFFGNPTKLLIIGFSSYSMAFLRKLAFEWNSVDHKNSDMYTCLSHLHVTVICKPGAVEAAYNTNINCPYCSNNYNCFMTFQNTSCYVRDSLSRMDLRHWVYFVPGIIESVDSTERVVKLIDKCEINYDTLLIMNSTIYKLKIKDPYDYRNRLPTNLIEINSIIDKIILMYKIRVLLEDRSGNYKILVYGNNIGTIQCLNFLLTHGVTTSHIIWVKPRNPIGTDAENQIKTPFADTNIQYILEDMITDMDVVIHHNYNFAYWVRNESGNYIMQVVFTKNLGGPELRLDCDLFISFEFGYIPHESKTWLLSAGIKFQGNEILVDQNFRTNIPNIYAVGNHIVMPNETNYQYHFTSEREVAEKLIHILNLNTHDPTGVPYDHKFSQPYYYQAQLPNGYLFTKLQMPRRYLHTIYSQENQCAMTTYKNNIFCRVSLSPKMIVDQIVVVSKDSTRVDYLEFVCGKHETLLNNLRARYKAGSIKCLLKFFQEPWTELIMHERFSELQLANHILLRPAIHNQLMNNKGLLVQVNTKEFLKLNKQYLEERLLNFLRKYRRDFQHQFALPEDYLKIDNLQ